jgi:hypothetical protein
LAFLLYGRIKKNFEKTDFMDWLKTARDLEAKADHKKYRQEQDRAKREQEILQAESDWLSRVMKMVQQVSNEGFIINSRQRGNQIELSRKGKVIIEFKEHELFQILYHDVQKPTLVMVSHPINVRHHRLVRLRELNDHNIEEAVKFAALGMSDYCKVAKYSRIERNLNAVLGISKVDEHT